jgi:hypothetical protein
MLKLMLLATTVRIVGAAGSYPATCARVRLDNAEGVSLAQCTGVLIALWKLCV